MADPEVATPEAESETCNICKATLPMGEWLKEESAECRPCLMGPVVGWYLDVLKEKGREDLAGELNQAVEELQGEDEVVKIGEKMDAIKEVVAEELRERLKEFDCTVQVYAKKDEGEVPEGALTRP